MAISSAGKTNATVQLVALAQKQQLSQTDLLAKGQFFSNLIATAPSLADDFLRSMGIHGVPELGGPEADRWKEAFTQAAQQLMSPSDEIPSVVRAMGATRVALAENNWTLADEGKRSYNTRNSESRTYYGISDRRGETVATISFGALRTDWKVEYQRHSRDVEDLRFLLEPVAKEFGKKVDIGEYGS